MTDVLVNIGVTMLGVGIAVLFSIAMAAIPQRHDEQAKRTGCALASTPDLSDFSEDEIAEQLEVRRVLREVTEANAFRAELAGSPVVPPHSSSSVHSSATGCYSAVSSPQRGLLSGGSCSPSEPSAAAAGGAGMKIVKDSWGKWVLVTKTHAYSLDVVITWVASWAVLAALGGATLLLDHLPTRVEAALILLVIVLGIAYAVRQLTRPR